MPASSIDRGVCARATWTVWLCLALALGSSAACAQTSERVVEMTDADGDGRLSGSDVEAALRRCRPGCRLKALPDTYHDVAVRIGRGFPEGLVLEGAGAGQTIFRAPVPSRDPVFWIDGGPEGMVLRGFSIDGRKTEQPDAARAAHSIGIRVGSPSLANTPGGRIEDVEISGMMTTGIVIRDGRGWRVTGSRIHDIGCHTDFPCPALRRPAKDPYIEGRKTAGYGILVMTKMANDTVVEDNEVWNVTKIGIEAYTNRAREVPGEDFVSDVTFQRNRVRRALAAGITANGARRIRILENEVRESGGSGVRGNGGSGITCGGPSGELLIHANRAVDNQGPGIRLSCEGDDLVVTENVVEGNCTARPKGFGAVHIGGRKELSAGLRLEGNRVSAGGCEYALQLARWRDVTLDGGSWEGGGTAACFVLQAKDVTIRKAEVAGGNGPGLLIRKDAEAIRVEKDARITSQGRQRIRNQGQRNLHVEDG